MDQVNHPDHYKAGKMECIDVMVVIFGAQAVRMFCLLNAFKYMFRFRRKNGLEDVKKARWYLNWYIEHYHDKEGSSAESRE